jgi:hypothetical protein
MLLQIAQESLEWDSVTGQTFLEKTVDGFLAELFDKWKAQGVNHIVSIVLFCRVATKDGKMKDYYEVAVEWESHLDWHSILPRIRRDAMTFLESVKGEDGANELVRARCGNFLEAIHLALMIFDKHFVDRDLSKTGMSIVAVTPGNGHFVVDDEESYTLCRLAKRKVIDDGIWLQLICLDRQPLYSTPLLEIISRNDGMFQKHYKPYWMRCGFYAGTSQWNDEPCHLPSTPCLWPQRRGGRALTSDHRPPPMTQHSLPSDISLRSLLSSDDGGHSPASIELSHYYNPCDPKASRIHHCQICSLKWSLLTNKSANAIDDMNQSLDWFMLVAPPCLPLRTRVEVSEETLKRDFLVLSSYKVVIGGGKYLLVDGAGPLDLMNELVSLRIALGMQELMTDYENEHRSTLVMNHDVHRIERHEDGALVTMYVRRPRNHKRNTTSVPYTAFIKPRLHSEFSERHFDLFPSNNFVGYPWEQIDNMVAGQDVKEVDGGRYWQSRFILIPAEEPPRTSLIMATAANEILDDEELRIAGFLKFAEVFQRCSLTRPSPTFRGKFVFRPRREAKREQSSIEGLKILLTTATCASYAVQESRRIQLSLEAAPSTPGQSPLHEDEEEDPSSVLHVEPLKQSDGLEHVAVMMQHPLVGLSIKNRRWHWRMYASVFVGSAAVDWMLKFFDDLTTREEAVTYGNRLMDEGVLQHILGTHRFLDGYYYYRFNTSFDITTLRKGNPKILQTISSGHDELSSPESAKSDERELHEPQAIVMSRTVVIDVDREKRSISSREWAFLHYDSTHNPKNTFHFRLHWLTCSARLVDDLIQSWARRALQCGFVMLEAPVEVPGSLQKMPFRTPLLIEFSVKPPRVEDLNKRLGPNVTIAPIFFAKELLRRHGFVLDYESDDKFPQPNLGVKKWSSTKEDSIENTQESPVPWKLVWSYDRSCHELSQYVHRSGVAIVQIDGDALRWTSNRLLLASTASRTIRPSQQSHFFELEADIRASLVSFCADAEALGQFWSETLADLGRMVGIDDILDDIPDDLAEGAEGVVGSPESLFERISSLSLF